MDMFTMFTSYGHNQIIRSQNKITDFFMILAWACPSISLYGIKEWSRLTTLRWAFFHLPAIFKSESLEFCCIFSKLEYFSSCRPYVILVPWWWWNKNCHFAVLLHVRGFNFNNYATKFHKIFNDVGEKWKKIRDLVQFKKKARPSSREKSFYWSDLILG